MKNVNLQKIGRPIHPSFNTDEKIRTVQMKMHNLNHIYNQTEAIQKFNLNCSLTTLRTKTSKGRLGVWAMPTKVNPKRKEIHDIHQVEYARSNSHCFLFEIYQGNR
jgi:hypothetical protein